MFNWLSDWFYEPPVPRSHRRTQYWVLGLLILAGTFIRFWGLGNVGLHGDEETMALAAKGLLSSGEPILPSGMYYSRALIHTYLLAGSIALFGESEWALRLPSALVGVLSIPVAFLLGRRFLPCSYNLAFAAVIAFLPAMIEFSQTARMYVFWVTFVLLFGVCVFRWESRQNLGSYVVAMAVWLVALHFHRLSVFLAPMFLFPGLSQRSPRLFWQGAVGVLGAGTFFVFYNAWIGNKYPSFNDRPAAWVEPGHDAAANAIGTISQWTGLGGSINIGIIIAALAVSIYSFRSLGWKKIGPLCLLGAGLMSMVFLQYHVAALLFTFGTVLWIRTPGLPRSGLVALILLALGVAVFQLSQLHSTGLYPGRKLIGAVVGQPSVWPTLRFLEYSYIAGFVYVVTLAFAAATLARGREVPTHFLFFAIAVWAPLLAIGILRGYVPPRYMAGQIGFFLMCVFAGLYFLKTLAGARNSLLLSGANESILLALVSLCIVNPIALYRVTPPDYDRYPDHKGAADYIKSLDLTSGAIIIAEDVLQQTYYLGKIDYWLREIDDARGFSIVRDGQAVDQYTATPAVGTGPELESILDGHEGSDVFILGSGEDFEGSTRNFRGHGIAEVLNSDRLEIVYEGRDGRTKVWRLRN